MLALCVLGTFLAAGETPSPRTADEVLVVFNENSPISKRVAAYYAQKRQVHQALAIRCEDATRNEDAETIEMPDYRQQIETPLRDYLRQHDTIEFIVLAKGVPLRISGADSGQRPDWSTPDTPLTTSVDSHLALLGYAEGQPGTAKIPITGSGAIGTGWLSRYWNAAAPFHHRTFGGYLVMRLDGYTEGDAKGLVDRALLAERGPWSATGKVLLDAQPVFDMGDKDAVPVKIGTGPITEEYAWSIYNAELARAHDFLTAHGIADEFDATETFVGDRTGLMGYFSWGSNDAKFSPAAYASLRFAPGSIGDTAVSTCGRTFQRTSGGQSLISDLIAHGLTCVKGYVDEPLLQANASPTILFDRLVAGYTIAESFYAASRFVGWQDIVIGDPLYTPFRAHGDPKAAKKP